MTLGANRVAAEAVVAALRAGDVLGERDETLVAGLLGLAAAVDVSPEVPALWREYRGFIEAVRLIGAGVADDDTAEFLVSVRTPLGDAAVPGAGDVRPSDRRSREAARVAVDAVAGTGGARRRRARS